MRLNRLLIVLYVVFVALAVPTSAFAFSATQGDYIQPEFLSPQLLPPPPNQGSKVWAKQIEAVLQAQRNISASDYAAMKDEQALRLEMMTALMGPTFTRDRLPKTFALLDRVMSGTKRVVETDKNFWHTKRPYLTDARVKLNIDPLDDSPAYPSGHTTTSLVLAEVLGMLSPDKFPALRAKADAIARRRIEAGVHFPVDVDGGRLLAMLITGALTENDDFQDDLAIAHKEMTGKN